MVAIDDELVNPLIQPDQYNKIGKDAPIKGIIRLQIKDYETEVYIGKRRAADILLTVVKDSSEYKVVVEFENDREFDVGKILRKIKKHREYPVVVIIPKEFERYAWRFQNSGIGVAFWTTTCKWYCRACKQITTSVSSITPYQCSNCKKGSNCLIFGGIENTKFERAENNPPVIDQVVLRIRYDKEISVAK